EPVRYVERDRTARDILIKRAVTFRGEGDGGYPRQLVSEGVGRREKSPSLRVDRCPRQLLLHARGQGRCAPTLPPWRLRFPSPWGTSRGINRRSHLRNDDATMAIS